MNIAIVDDSAEDRERLAGLIRDFSTENSVAIHITAFKSGEEFLKTANLADLDALFLDIFMDKIDGVEVAKKLYTSGSACKILFTTSSDAFAVKSYELRVFHYLLKPLTAEKVNAVLRLLDKSAAESSRYIVVKEGRSLRKVPLCDIIYIDYHNHYTQLHTADGVICTYKKFSEFAAKFEKFSAFLTCYRCIMVNMNQVEKMDDGFFLMKNGEQIPINRAHAKEIRADYVNYVFGEIESGGSDENTGIL